MPAVVRPSDWNLVTASSRSWDRQEWLQFLVKLGALKGFHPDRGAWHGSGEALGKTPVSLLEKVGGGGGVRRRFDGTRLGGWGWRSSSTGGAHGGGGGNSAGPRTPTTPAPPPPPPLGAFGQQLVANSVALRRPWAPKAPDAP